MELGFMPDATSPHGYTALIGTWAPGVPERSFLQVGIKPKQLAQAMPIYAYRCPKCFRLELVATKSS